jgi:hypothetical protein
VRDLGPEARALGDRAFLETVIRAASPVRAPPAGLKSAGIDYGLVIPAAEDAVETGDPKKLKIALAETIDQALAERLAHIREFQRAPKPQSAANVPRARERISAELGFITFAEGIGQAALGRAAGHHLE